MSEECLICGAPLVYLETAESMECAFCHRVEQSLSRCVHGHYVCNDCHTAGLDAVLGYCLASDSDNPLHILEGMMSMPFCHMHGPEHHVMVGAALLTAYAHAGGQVQLDSALQEMLSRGKNVPGGACGFWGACGAAISTGIFVSIISGSTPLTDEPFALSNAMTSAVLAEIAKVGGPRCCKRNSYLALKTAIPFVREHFGVEMSSSPVVCSRMRDNNQCIGIRCPFSTKAVGTC